MPLQKNLNVAPYYADYNPASDYYKVLYKAGYPIQARELTNQQLMLQNQIETFMSVFLKEIKKQISTKIFETTKSTNTPCR